MTRGTRSRSVGNPELRSLLGFIARRRGDGRRSGGVGARRPRPGMSRRSGRFDLISYGVACPGGVPPEAAECRARHRAMDSSGGLGNVSVTYTLPLAVGPPRPVTLQRRTNPTTCRSLRQAARNHRPAHRRKQGRDHHLHARRGSTVRVSFCTGRRNEHRWTSRRSSRSPAAQARSPRRRGEGSWSSAPSVGGDRTETWTGTLEAPGFDVRPHTAETDRSRCEDGARGEGCEERPRDLLGDGHRRRRRRRSCLVPAEVGQPLQDRPHDGRLRGHRLQRQHRQRGVHGHR